MKTFLDWLLKSSGNPQATSLTVKGFLLGLIPFAMKAIGLGCTLALVCIHTDASELTNVALAVSNIVFWALSLIAGIMFVWGFGRKVVTTATGTNPVLNR